MKELLKWIRKMAPAWWLILSLCPTTLHGQTREEAQSLHNKGRELTEAGKIAEGREYTKRALEMRKQLFGEVNEDYINSLNNYANTFILEEDFDKAIEIQNKVLELCNQLKPTHPNLGMFLTNMGRIYFLQGNLAEAAKKWEEALSNVEKHGEMYEYLLENLGNTYNQLNDMPNLERLLALMTEHNEYQLKQPCEEPGCMLERAQYYAAIEENAKAKECFLKLLAMPMNNEMKINAYKAYASFLYLIHDYVAASEYLISSANLQKEIAGVTEEYAQHISKAAAYCFIGKKYQQSVELYKTAIDFYAKHQKESDFLNEVQCYKGMGNAYSGSQDYEAAIICFQKVISYYEANEPDNAEYPKAILRLAKMEKFNKNYDASIEHHKQAIQMFNERNMTEEYADATSSLQLCYVYAGKQQVVNTDDKTTQNAQAIKLNRIIHEESSKLQLYRNNFGELVYAQALATIAGSYYLKETYDSAVYYYKQYMESVRKAIRDEFRLQSEGERMITWREEEQNIKQIKEMMVMLPPGNEKLMPDLAALVYDAELLSKGILLKSAIEFSNILEKQGNAKLKGIYQQCLKNEQEIGQLRTTASTDEDVQKILSLSQQNQALTLQLYKECQEFADFTDYLSFDWKDVQKQLMSTDLAIEFAAIQTGVFDENNFMVALVLTHDMTSPAVVPICHLSEAKSMENNEQLFTLQTNVVWGALTQFLANKHRVFFSADGSFNQIGIEYLNYNGSPLSEQMEVYRLSSTKELCYRQPKPTLRKAVLFGDINYNSHITRQNTNVSKSDEEQRGAGDMEAFANLSNTLLEVNEIFDILKKGVLKDISKYTDTDASKTAFLTLNNSDLNLLHIATHSVYKRNDKNSEAESMDNCLLAFAGANIDDNGIITAAEIASMNLRQCDLAVLSACETGLGKLGSDGVYGLQRGFKNAGVRTLLMSLQKVYDKATAELMIKFYQHWMNGFSKREALIKAQQELREAGYKDSRYWATFILLDAY